MLRLLTAGESHGKAMLAILEGLPAGINIDEDSINQELKRRKAGFGRGPRMKFEEDIVQMLSGIRKGVSLGSPLAFLIDNKDASIEDLPMETRPRPGHADLAGALKYGFSDIRNVLERASARETVSRVAAGAVCKIFLGEFKINISSKVISIGGETKEKEMKNKIQQAINKRDTIGGIFEVVVKGAPVGLGSYAQFDRRLDARLAAILVSIPGIKAVEFGLGFGFAKEFGSCSHDAIYYTKDKTLPAVRQGFYRKTNNAGGIEGGVTNGEYIIIRCCMKPISTLLNPLDSVDMLTKKSAKATVQRSDICVVEAAGVVAESAVAFELANAMLEKFGQDSLSEIKRNYKGYLNTVI